MSTYVKSTRVRVNRSLGAVAVYNRPRAVAIVVAVIAILAGAGYVAGRLTAPDTVRTVAAKAVAPAPATVKTVVRADQAAVAAAERRGFARGVRHGAARAVTVAAAPNGATALGALAKLPAGTPFIVTRTGRGLGFKLPVVSGFLYRMCPDGRGICRRPGS